MDLTIDLAGFIAFFAQPPTVILWTILVHGGWVGLLFVIGLAAFKIRLFQRQMAFLAKQEHLVLAIDVPRENEQSFKASEQIFSALWGVYGPGTWVERNWDGKVPLGFSFEIVSVEGAVQYLVRTPVKYRSLVEGAIYSQYPDAEITEVEDYFKLIPANAWEVDSGFKLWGTQGVLAKHTSYPIRTYPDYQDSTIKEGTIDPIAPLLEAFSRLGPGEVMAMQILFRPVNDSWTEGGRNLVKKVIGEKVVPKKHIGDRAVDAAVGALGKLGDAVIPGGEAGKTEKRNEPRNQLMSMTKAQLEVVEAIEHKMSKSCFQARLRHLYVARDSAFTKVNGVAGFWGALRSFSGPHINGFRPGPKTTTEAFYFRVVPRLVKKRKRILAASRTRSYTAGTDWCVLSTEELASLWHFPLKAVKTPLVSRAGARRSEPPVNLPSPVVEESLFAPSGLGGEVALPEPAEPATTFLDLTGKDFESRLSRGGVPQPLGVPVPQAPATLSTPPPPAPPPSIAEPPAPRGAEPPPNLPLG